MVKPMDEQDKRKESTLAEFVEENHKLLTTLGVLVAITLFARQISIPLIASFISFALLGATIMVWLELWSRFPKNGSMFLRWFEDFISLSLFMLIAYWFLEYGQIWKKLIFLPIAFLLLWIITRVIRRFNLVDRLVPLGSKAQKQFRYILGTVILYATLGVALVASLLAPPVNSWIDRVRELLKSP